jgi:hypothetical protein
VLLITAGTLLGGCFNAGNCPSVHVGDLLSSQWADGSTGLETHHVDVPAVSEAQDSVFLCQVPMSPYLGFAFCGPNLTDFGHPD